MRHLLLIGFLLITFLSRALAADGLCFKAIQGGKEVSVLCAGQEVSFRNCSVPTPAGSTIIFYPGKIDASYDKNKELAEGQTYRFPGVGRYTITLIINRSADQSGSDTETLEQVFEVKDNPAPTFTAAACANRKVSVNLTDQQYDTYTIRYSDGQQETVPKGTQTIAHTYTTNGPYEVTVTGNYQDATCTSPSVKVTVKQLPAYTSPAITSLQVLQQDAANGSLELTFNNLLDGYQYSLTKKAASENSFSTVTTLAPGQTTYRLSGINTTQITEYRIEATDGCGTVLTGSNILSNIVLTARAESEQNVVQWESISTFQSTSIFRNGALLSLTNPASPYIDTDVACEQEYCYEVRGTTAAGAVSSSVVQCVTSFSIRRPPTGTLLATYNLNNQIELTLRAPAGQNITEVNVEHSLNGAPFTSLATAFEQPYLVELDEPVSVCYRANYKNGCALSEFSAEACPMLLTGRQVNGSINLNWSAYVSFPDGIASYTVEVLDENDQLVTSYPATGTNFTDRSNSNNVQLLRYRVKATSNNGTVTYSNLVVVEQEVQLHIPSGFTPNGDGLNDVFEVKGRFIKDFKIRIYNGMGQVVYSSSNREEGWDGTFNGTPLPAGAYAYEVMVTSSSNKAKRRTGTVTLLR